MQENQNMGRDQWFGDKTYSQHGEDLFILNAFHLMGIDKPSYLDLGAHHPTEISNTALLYQRGSRGVNVEANPRLIASFDYHRPEDRNVNCAVGATEGRANFYMYDELSGRNTLCEEEHKIVSEKYPSLQITKTIEVPVFTANQIVYKFCDGVFPDLLSVDIEGLDFDVLNSCNFSESKPKIICVEVRQDTKRDFHGLMSKEGYFCVCRFIENLIFVHKDYYLRLVS